MRRQGSVFDVEQQGEEALEAAGTIINYGFSEHQMRSIFEAAGAGADFQFTAELEEFVIETDTADVKTALVRRQPFIARGTKA